ncbi:MAG: protein kinase [Candidatus Acidiferrales bacterium]
MRKLGKYEVHGELGHGAMGVVYRARDPIINRMVALKTITTGLAEDPNLLQRFYREAQSAGGLQHPNIVTIYDMGDDQNTPYIAMELIEGESLEQTIARRTIVPLALKLTYALQACRAFDYAHKRGIVHRDIKPGNVMVNKEGVVKVVDFGIARVLDKSKTQTGMLIGTFAYMSPEQYHGDHADERSDIWSFGVLLYELMCYERPFKGDNPASLMHNICSQEPRSITERVPDCPPAMEAIISKVLRKLPEDRFQSMEDLLLELEPVYKELQLHSISELIDQSRQLIEQGEFPQARELLRESLKVDAANSQARALLEKVNAELKRLLIRPKAQQHVDKGRALLAEGKIQEARAEAENALQLDAAFDQAQELEKQVQRELDRAHLVAEWLQASRQRLAEGMPDEAEELLAKVLELEPGNKQAAVLQQQVLVEKADRLRRLRLLERMQEARGLWTQLNYSDCIEILSELQKEFPAEEEVQRLLDTVQEDQAEQHRQRTLEGARNHLAVGNFAESRALLVDLQQQFPSDEEIPRLLEDIRIDEAKQRRIQGLAEARIYLANRQYEESIVLLTTLEKEFPDDREILQLLEAVRADQAEQQKQQDIAEARTLLAARRYDECAALVAKLQRRFPIDKELPELQKAIRHAEAEQRKHESLANARNLLAARRFEESITLLTGLGEEFPADEEVPKLLQAAQAEQAEERKQKDIAEVRNLLAAQGYDGCNLLLAKLQKQFPNDLVVLELQKTVQADQAEQQRQQGIAQARNLLATRRYDECNALLAELRKQFSDDSDVAQLQKAVEEDQAEQRKHESLANARNLLASKNYEESIAILTRMGEEFPADEEVSKLLQTAHAEQSEERKQKDIAEVRNLLAARRYDECTALLAKLQKQFPSDSEVSQLQGAVREDQAEQEKLGTLAKARSLLAKRNYDECIALLSELGKRFPKDGEIPRLLTTARDGLAEQRKSKSLTEARSLLAARRYDESISRLTDLKNEFPDEREISRLLSNAAKEQAEQQKQTKLAEGRSLLAAQRFGEALELLDTLRAAHPKDSAVQKLRALVEREREKQSRSEGLQRELEALKKLVSEKKYPELLARAEPLKVEFPANGDLLRLIDFARNQQAQIESEKRLRATIDAVKAHMREDRFWDAIRAANAALKSFPDHAELVSLREQAEAQDKKQRAREMIEQRIREIKFKINREDFSDAIDLAKETLAITGPNTDLTQLLHSAVVEFQARAKRRQQEQKLQEIRALTESGNVDGAAETLRVAVQAETFDALDPRVSRVAEEIDAAKSTPTVVSPTSAPSAPASFSKEYAFLQGRPLDAEPPAAENAGPTETGTPQASATQPPISSQPAAPMRPPQFKSAPPAPNAPVVFPRTDTASAPVVPATPKNPMGPARVPERMRDIATRTEAAAPPRGFKKTAMLAAIAMGLILGVWATVHLISRHKAEVADVRSAQPTNSRVGTTTNANPPTTPVVPARPVVSPEEAQQRNAIALSDKLVASGDLQGALRALQGADQLNGPLTAEIKNRETTVGESMRNDSLAKLRQQEATLWQRATSEVEKGEFDAAKRDLQKILAAGDGGVRRADAQRYLNDVVPKRQKEESVFRQAQQSSRANDQQGLQRASDLFGQVMAFEGPRKSEAEELQRNVEAKLASLKQQSANRQIAALEAAARSDLQQGNLDSARQYAEQIKQAGGDSAALLKEIDQAQASQARTAQQQREFQQAVQAYNAVGSRDKVGLEKSRSDFVAIVRENGPQAADAQRYLTEISKKVDALNQPPSPPPSVKTEASSVAVDEAAIRDVIQRFILAFEQRSPDGVSQVWPSIPAKTYAGYKRSFEDAIAIRMQMLDETVKINPDRVTATVSARVAQQYTPKGQKTLDRSDLWVFELSKKSGTWTITDVR